MWHAFRFYSEPYKMPIHSYEHNISEAKIISIWLRTVGLNDLRNFFDIFNIRLF